MRSEFLQLFLNSCTLLLLLSQGHEVPELFRNNERFVDVLLISWIKDHFSEIFGIFTLHLIDYESISDHSQLIGVRSGSAAAYCHQLNSRDPHSPCDHRMTIARFLLSSLIMTRSLRSSWMTPPPSNLRNSSMIFDLAVGVDSIHDTN
jgi:hypothetical protein